MVGVVGKACKALVVGKKCIRGVNHEIAHKAPGFGRVEADGDLINACAGGYFFKVGLELVAVGAGDIDSGSLGKILSLDGEFGKRGADTYRIVLVGVDEQFFAYFKRLFACGGHGEVGKRAHGHHHGCGRGRNTGYRRGCLRNFRA